mmetsp:Transcript_72969/g.207967  ORF Transcript_72969/g.207967 Transcript_72969/m.207967 type:complete len:195 (-) Transcript_72969:278-862(-)
MWPLITGSDTTVLRDNVPMGLDYKSTEGALVLYTHGSYYKLMLYKSCDGWWAPWDGNATVSPDAKLGETVSDDELDGWCDSSGDKETSYKMYNLSEDPSETTNIYDESEYATIQGLLQKHMCAYWQPKEDMSTLEGTGMVDSAFTRANAFNDFFEAAYHNDRYVTYWKERENAYNELRYPMSEYFEVLDFCKVL